MDRVIVREGLNADLLILDPDAGDQNMPELVNELPAGAQRLTQTSTGIQYTIANGQILLKGEQHSGDYPGKLVSGSLA